MASFRTEGSATSYPPPPAFDALHGGLYCTEPVDPFDALLLLAGGLTAGVVNTLAGGGSLLTVPLLTFVGLPGTLANGTNRVGILIQNGVASWGFWREGVPGVRAAAPLIAPVAGGALLGAYGISRVDDALFERLFGVVMLVLLVPTLRSAGGANGAGHARPLPGWLRVLLFFGIGLYGGAFQAGVGILLIYGVSPRRSPPPDRVEGAVRGGVGHRKPTAHRSDCGRRRIPRRTPRRGRDPPVDRLRIVQPRCA